jgi:hypothetical protein
MKSLVLVPLLFATALDTTRAAVQVPDHLINPARPKIEDPDHLVQHFLDAVDRGELIVFGRALNRSMIVPTRVEYVYDLATRKTLAKVFSNLKVPLPVPERDCKVVAVSVIMAESRIVEIESHIWMEE